MHRKDGGVRSAVAAFPMQYSIHACAARQQSRRAVPLCRAGHPNDGADERSRGAQGCSVSAAAASFPMQCGLRGLSAPACNRVSACCRLSPLCGSATVRIEQRSVHRKDGGVRSAVAAFPMQYSIHACAARQQSRRAVPLCRAGHPNDGADERSRGAQGCSVSAAAASFPMQCGLRGLSAPACNECRHVAACRHVAEAPLSASSSAACTGRMGESGQLWRRSRCSPALRGAVPRAALCGTQGDCGTVQGTVEVGSCANGATAPASGALLGAAWRSRCSTAYMHVQPDSSPDARCLCAEPDIRTMEQMSAAEARRAALSVQQLHRSRCNAG